MKKLPLWQWGVICIVAGILSNTVLQGLFRWKAVARRWLGKPLEFYW